MSKTILVYATRFGATAETAKEIIRVINQGFNIEVDLVNLKDKETGNPDISNYDNVILGVSYAKFNWAKEGKNFLKRNKEILENKKLFVFVSSGRCGGAWKSKNYSKYESLQKKFIDDKLGKIGLSLTSRRAFGGYYINQPPEKAETRDWDMIRSWANEVGQILSSS
ncbi:MAG: flavodoxin domain-containing protein [Candidatus Hodarchaeales archaeon]|jgi:menaquinone-dependent protoporphyrinogen IX oxidase